MKIKYIGEVGLIERIKKKIKLNSKEVIVGIGDDSAVLNYDNDNYLLFTTDSLVENVHFSLDHWTPEQIGMKAVVQNVSDIAAMGGLPRFCIISLALPNDIEASFVDSLYNGICKKSKKYKIDIVGGNVTSSKEISIGIALIGFVEKKYLTLRSGAKTNDLIFCSGNLGESTTGLELLRNKRDGKSIKRHLEPETQLDLARKLVKVGVNSMIDVSDGIASEIQYICKESNVGAIIYADKIPISKNAIIDSKKIGKEPIEFALYGGEDFELVFTAPTNKLNKLRKYDIKVIGQIVDKRYGIKLIKNNKEMKLGRGFDHFMEKP